MAIEKAMVEAERLEKVLNAWFGRALKKTFMIWRNHLGWKRGGKAQHIANINAWRQQRDLKNAMKAWRKISVGMLMERRRASMVPD